MKAYKNGSISWTAQDLYNWTRGTLKLNPKGGRWPCYGGQHRAGWASFDSHGNLVDLSRGASKESEEEPSGFLAFLEDLQEWSRGQLAPPATEPEVRAAALKCARGTYQRGLLQGFESWSGATLQGTARSYGYFYAQSRDSLLKRLNTKTGLRWLTGCDPQDRGRRILCVEVAGQWLNYRKWEPIDVDSLTRVKS